MAADLFVVPTVTFRLLFVLVILAHDRRRIVHVAVTEHPTAGWIAQQLRNVFPEDHAPRYLVHDRDGAFAEVASTVAGMNIEPVRTAPRFPWQNAYVERLIGSIRRECLDHVIVVNEIGLRRVLASYVAYYMRSRTHPTLAKTAPVTRPVQSASIGRIVATVCLFALFPWGGTVGVSGMAALQLWFLIGWVVLAVVVLRSVWAPTRITHDAPEGRAERFRRHHPVLGRRIVLSRGSRRIVLVIAAGCAVASWVGLEDLDRYVWGAVALSAALALFLTTWNDL